MQGHYRGQTVRELNHEEKRAIHDDPSEFSFDPINKVVHIPVRDRSKNAYETTVATVLERGVLSDELMIATYSTSTGWTHYHIAEIEGRHYLISKSKKKGIKLMGFIARGDAELIKERIAKLESEQVEEAEPTAEEIAAEEAEVLALHGIAAPVAKKV